MTGLIVVAGAVVLVAVGAFGALYGVRRGWYVIKRVDE